MYDILMLKSHPSPTDKITFKYLLTRAFFSMSPIFVKKSSKLDFFAYHSKPLYFSITVLLTQSTYFLSVFGS